MDGRSKGPPPKPAKRQPREAPSAAPPDKPPPRPEVKGRARPPPVAAPSSEPAPKQEGGGDDSIMQPLDLGREHEGIPHGWSPSYWKYVTRPNKLERSRKRLLNITAYYRISKIYDIGLMLCLILLVILVIFAGVYSDILY